MVCYGKWVSKVSVIRAPVYSNRISTSPPLVCSGSEINSVQHIRVFLAKLRLFWVDTKGFTTHFQHEKRLVSVTNTLLSLFFKPPPAAKCSPDF